ncbi:DUF5018 domain-containing protein [Chitinophaga horti]|uniref:DUF5018 domain-containing protein n=1 Tax=Chitinophaga horti TaxID=2920382 RepID=A0ABY6IZ00_9BACT|nr:DUF5018 domain-containing protein [Chitinophaga horti]UYQ92629.1 DUF5018 domain-containing protein [Chitinophaga horti]
MRNIFSTIILTTFTAAMFSGCAKPDAVTPKDANELSDIYGTKTSQGRDRLFEARYSTAKDTIYFDIPYFYPADSDEETDLTQIILRGTIPTDARLMPSLGTTMDLSKPFDLVVTSGTGLKKKYVVVGKKVGDNVLRKAVLTFTADGVQQQLEGVVQPNNDVIFYVVPGVDVSGATISYEINPHSNASIATGAAVNLAAGTQAFTITGVDGVARTYTLKAQEPVKQPYGIGITRKLFSKTAAELGFVTHNDVAIAVSGDYLVLCRRLSSGSNYRVYNRFTGAYLQDMHYPFGTQISFQIAEDNKGRILAASWAPKNAKFILYKYNNPMDASPVKLLEWTNNNPAGITLDGGVGRRVNIYGDLNGDAVIMAPAGQSTTILRWRIAGGVLVNQNPEVLIYQSITGAAHLGYYAEAQPVSATANANYFINYQFEIGYVNGATQSRLAGFVNDAQIFGSYHMPTNYTTFNNANYLAILKYTSGVGANNIARLSLFDVTNTSLLGTAFNSVVYPSFNVFVSAEELRGDTNPNGTGDVAIGFTENGERMQIYTLLTNAGLMGHEFTNYAK